MERELRQLVSSLREDIEAEEGGRGSDEEGEGGKGFTSASVDQGGNSKIREEITALHQALATKNKHLE